MNNIAGEKFTRPDLPSRKRPIIRQQFLSRSQDNLSTTVRRKNSAPPFPRPQSVLGLSKESEGRGVGNKENQKGQVVRNKGSRPPVNIRKAVSSIAIHKDMSNRDNIKVRLCGHVWLSVCPAYLKMVVLMCSLFICTLSTPS